MPGAADLRYRRRPAVLWRSTLGGPVVLGPAQPEPVVLSGTAALVWEALDAPMTAAELASALGASPIEPVLARLSDDGLVSPCP